MAISRRLFSRGAVVAPLALGGPQHVPTLEAPYIGGPPIPHSTSYNLSQKIWKAIRYGTKMTLERENARYTTRQMMGGLDPDLAVLNSMSLTRRVAIQLDREKAALERQNSLRNRIIRGLGGNPEEFEY